MTNTEDVRRRLLGAEKQLAETFVGRDDAIRAVLLAHVARVNYLLIGVPGTAKTAIARCFSEHVTGANVFRTLLGSFTTPEQVFGPLDIKAFQAGTYRTVTAGKLPAADIAVLDEALKASDGMLNTLLALLNEREFEGQKCPLLCCGGATNWPEVEARSARVEALYDRWLLRVPVAEVEGKDELAKMLRAVDLVASYAPRDVVTADELRAAGTAAAAVKVPEELRGELAALKVKLGRKRDSSGRLGPGVEVSARRLGQLQSVLRASAWLAGREAAAIDDFGAIVNGLWTERAEHEVVVAVVGSLDQEAKAEGVAHVDAARKAMRDFEARTDKGIAQFNEAVLAVRQRTGAARALHDGPRLSGRSREQLAAQMRQLVGELEAFAKKYRGTYGGSK